MSGDKIAAYAGAAVAVAIGVALLWIPPSAMAGQAATAGLAMALVTGGLAAVGISVTVPAVKAAAYRAAVRDTARDAAVAPPSRAPSRRP